MQCRTLRRTEPPERGPDVRAVQVALRGHGFDPAALDGVYGPLTASAVELFKRWQGIRPLNPVVDLPVYHRLGVTCVGSPAETEQLEYNNPLAQTVETVWFDGRKYWAVGPHIRLPVDASRTKIAQGYITAYSVSAHGRPKLVPLQINIRDSIPGMPEYSPIWRLNFVIVPSDYVPNSIRSAAQALSSGHPIVTSNQFVNSPIL